MIDINANFNYKQTAFHFKLQVKKGELIAIIGESGAGKSTLLNIISGFEKISSGHIFLDNCNHTKTLVSQRPISMLFQEHNVFSHLTVFENIALGLSPNLKLNNDQKQRIYDIANEMGIDAILEKKITAISGGQKQRVAIAREMLRDKPILLLDEPFSALDPNLRTQIFELINNIRLQKQITVLLVTHQFNEIKDKVDRVIEIDNGKNL